MVWIFFNDVGTRDVGRHEIGRELDAAELQAERLRDGADKQRLRRSGKAGDQAMAADEQRDQNLIEHFLLADDDPADLLDDFRLGLLEANECAASVPTESSDVTTGNGWVIAFIGTTPATASAQV